MTSPRPHPSGASSVLAFISFLSSFRTFLASLAPRCAARAEPSLCCRRRGPAARRGRPPSTLQTRFHPAGHSARRGPGPGRPRPGTGHAVTPPHPSTFARSAGSSPARPAGPGAGAVLGRGGVAGPGDREPGREPDTEQRAGEAAPKFASDSPGAAAAPWAEVYFLEEAPGFGLENPAAKIEPSSWSGSESPAENMERMSDSADKPIDNDAEGVWSPDIEQSFQEALAIYPPCGRRKIILSDEGKMYGRNELIARYIKLRTGKTRTRKQVSSHIQVLARRKSRDFHSKLKDQTAKDKALQHMAAMSSAQIVSATAIHNKLGLPGIPRPTFPGAPGFWPGMIQTGQPGSSQDVKPFVQQAYPIQPAVTAPIPGFEPASAPAPSVPAWQGRSIGTTKLRLVEFSAFLEQQRDPDSYNKHLFVHIGHANHSYSDPLLESVDIRQIYDKFPEKKGGLKELFGKGPQNAFFLVKFWADLNCNIQDDAGAFYGVTSQYESSENMTVTCSTKVCSFGKQVVEKVETEYARFENGRFVYRINRSPMCEYMINFIHKLKHLPEKYMMNSVLENFTILLVVTNRDTQETLLCMACVFEVSNSEHGAQHHIYRLVKD
ncbi:transcriptional enhancer factor TEF-1 isoform X6 [Trachypithecus francoisi]|uniref:transcriptional enhancer factor TEF-1 isoform X6 n=1 Tax=Trachypithecus francoisi TaxID=54180 RepID=UPI00141BC17B|nr:transcriptional enhancer factor TEF-1 isoform X6 [Trachypithecus francoisi]